MRFSSLEHSSLTGLSKSESDERSSLDSKSTLGESCLSGCAWFDCGCPVRCISIDLSFDFVSEVDEVEMDPSATWWRRGEMGTGGWDPDEDDCAATRNEP